MHTTKALKKVLVGTTAFALAFGTLSLDILPNNALFPAAVTVEAASTLRQGSRGREVKYLQYDLNILYFPCGSVDGIFGSGVKNAVKNYQRSKGLTADGIVGNATWNALYNDIKPIQEKLGVTADGIAGVNTINALKNFQRSHGLTADGICGPATRAALFSSGSQSSPSSNNGDRASLASQILNTPTISLAKAHPSGVHDNGFAYNNVYDTSLGQAASRSSYGNAPGGSVYLDPQLLQLLIDLNAQYGNVSVSEIAGASHSKNSLHYRGIAMDVTSCGGGVTEDMGRQIYNFLVGKGYSLSTVYPGTVREDSSHYHIALNK